MATLALSGLISGLDTDNIVSSLVQLQRGPINLLEQKQAVQNTKLSALQTLNARMLSLSVSAQTLSRSVTFQTKRGVSSNSSVVTVSAAESADPGTHTVEVLALARAQSIAGGTFSSNAEALGLEGQFLVEDQLITIDTEDNLASIAATLNNQVNTIRASVVEVSSNEYRLVLNRRTAGADSIELFEAGSSNLLQDLGLVTASTTLANPVPNGGRSGLYSQDATAVGTLMGLSSPASSGTITLDDGSGPIDIVIDLESDSLQNIADAINAEATLQGSTVTASVVTEGEGDEAEYRLEITGAADVTFTDDNNILQTLQILSPDLADEVQAGQDASFKINGISMTRQTNLVSGVVPGVSFVLNAADPGNPVTISINSDTSSAVSAIQSFINNYNTARQYILQQTSYDPETQTAGPLLGDSSVLTVERNMFNIVGTRVANVMLEDLADLNNGAGVDGGRIQITDRSGATAEIDLTQVTSVQGVINLINASGSISVTATTNPRGGGIMLVDTSGGTGYFEVVDLDGGSTAADLGLDQKARTDNLYGASVTTPGFTSISNMGVTTNSNGTLSLDLTILNQALSEDPRRVERLFSARDVGVAQAASQKLEFITQAQGGTISNRTTAIQNVIDDITERIEIGERRLVTFEERLQGQFAKMEQALAEFQSQSEYLSSQFANLGNVFKYRS